MGTDVQPPVAHAAPAAPAAPAERFIAEIRALRGEVNALRHENAKLLGEIAQQSIYITTNTRQISNWVVGLGMVWLILGGLAFFALLSSRGAPTY